MPIRGVKNAPRTISDFQNFILSILFILSKNELIDKATTKRGQLVVRMDKEGNVELLKITADTPKSTMYGKIVGVLRVAD